MISPELEANEGEEAIGDWLLLFEKRLVYSILKLTIKKVTGRVGENYKGNFKKTLVAQWIRHWSSKPGIAGSSPAGGV